MAITRRLGDDVIALTANGPVRVNEFLEQASGLAAALPPRDYVINLAGDRLAFLLGFCAAVIAGQCTLMPPNRQPETIRRLAEAYPRSYVLGDEAIDGVESVCFGSLDRSRKRGHEPFVADDQLCAIVFTSGSTGQSSPNRKYWRTLAGGTAANIDLLLDGSNERLNVVATVPPQHMWGFEMSVLLPLFSNVAISQATPFFPGDIFDAINSVARPRALVSSPVHLSAFLDADPGDVEIDSIYTATAPLSDELAERLAKRYDANVIDVFGCSESGIIAARRPAADEHWLLASPFTLESTSSGTLIRAGHLDEAVPLNDRLELLGDRNFRWIGRNEDMINIAGKRGSLAEMNHYLNALDGVDDGIVFQPGEDAKRLAALVVAPTHTPSDILERLRPSVEPAFLPRPVYLVDSLPRQETGKLSKSAVLELFTTIARERRPGNDDGDDD
ncbi:MAG: AMP-binding protein [Pseudomonadota bacterium]